MLVSAIASSVCLRKSFSFTGSSPRASRWALTAIRRYLATVTPGIATGYWKAMNRPIRERSSGSASVMSSPLKVIVPSVTSSAGVAHDRVGERGLAGAVGSHQGVDAPLLDVEVETLEDLLVLDADVQVADFEVGQFGS